MIICEKCNCCAHEKVCSSKEFYIKACEEVKLALGNKDLSAFVSVSIKCPDMLVWSKTKEVIK